MDKRQSDLCLELLRRLRRLGVLDQAVLVGSWCLLFYRAYFAADAWLPALKTRDLDVLIPEPRRLQVTGDVEEALRDLGFVLGFRGAAGYMMLQHPELILEFLVPERGRGCDKPCDLPGLGMNAQPLRFMDLLAARVIPLTWRNLTVPVPHPANFAIQKLIAAARRRDGKRERDVAQAVALLRALDAQGDWPSVAAALALASRKWRTTAVRILRTAGEPTLADGLAGLAVGRLPAGAGRRHSRVAPRD